MVPSGPWREYVIVNTLKQYRSLLDANYRNVHFVRIMTKRIAANVELPWKGLVMLFGKLHNRIGRILLLVATIACVPGLSEAFLGLGGGGDPPIHLKQVLGQVPRSSMYSPHQAPQP